MTLILALGIFLSEAAPSWAMHSLARKESMPSSTSVMMPGMAMQSDCMAMADNRTPKKETPSTSPDACCALCTACALPVGLLQVSSAVQTLARGDKIAIAQDLDRHGIAVLPALPPPILHA